MTIAARVMYDVGSRGAQAFGLMDMAVRDFAADMAERRATDIEAVSDLGDELVRTRRALAAAKSEIARARQESAVLAHELAAANARADRAKGALAVILRTARRA
ncbi:hypothetical protein FV226_15220 [Methylobacterium sp. WL12]|uniref:hypothetical protein n=1 Tax=Methylobacterium sp. WL12 TaxID=2603890 RepID=UPI0011C86184|nr:hypothetical protein [Methylobacterium sp. WL12]TXM71413.1 hypothetical protein FV226_15220 [Methylobacterium sp. WL12]